MLFWRSSQRSSLRLPGYCRLFFCFGGNCEKVPGEMTADVLWLTVRRLVSGFISKRSAKQCEHYITGIYICLVPMSYAFSQEARTSVFDVALTCLYLLFYHHVLKYNSETLLQIYFIAYSVIMTLLRAKKQPVSQWVPRLLALLAAFLVTFCMWEVA